jgi:hypothetical protein
MPVRVKTRRAALANTRENNNLEHFHVSMERENALAVGDFIHGVDQFVKTTRFFDKGSSP